MSIHKYLTNNLTLGIVIKIYEYYPKYKICMTENFNAEIMNYKIIKKIRSYFDNLLEDGFLWNTPYGTFSYYKDDIINNI